MNKIVITLIVCLLPFALKSQSKTPINIIYTSDAHYGIFREHFRGDTNVAGYLVNGAMIAKINTLPGTRLPVDGGVQAGQKIGYIDYSIQSGDIANRMEPPYQSATISWQQFENDYIDHLHLKDQHGKPTQLLVIPGNHDISNAIGYVKKMIPATDPVSEIGIYNMMLKPKVPLTARAFNYKQNKIHYSRDIGGVHFLFINLWPDSAERVWMAGDLKKVPIQIPVIIFAHDQPTCDPKHFNNPAAPGQFPAGSKFEDLTEERYKEGNVPQKGEHSTDLEQRGWVAFLKQHPNVKAYFHGNSNWNEFYVYHGPDNDVNLPVFRVDSPMKGDISKKDETQLSFQLITLDPDSLLLTVRECLWNTEPGNPKSPVLFGACKTIKLKQSE
ncbi:hypothetical protein CKK33_02045 [Mucilaginibacter sp. MD40]|uniref:metallophosphoesterase family protein n=1 Tax=Mucilaginibacter sp. MD40 TaxID=2029590 RepID=UPI000BAC9ABD|nr:metallophosphoesterase [Mucilaginibacter sp. MD40]PAW92337.1 hypothetical protein CKK33_02045 [Mucilaginibacter sp. MD40]